MKHVSHTIWIVAAAALAASGALAAPQTIDTRIGKLSFEHGLPTEKSVTRLFNEMDFQRAVQAYLWALPIVSQVQAKIAQKENTGAEDGDVGIYEGYRGVSVWLTANATTPYIIGFYDLSTRGPAVLDIPAGAIAGSAMDFWQRPFTDFGITGPDGGKGGKYLVVGPGQETPAAVEGYTVVHSPTFNFGYFYRALDTDPAKAEAIATGVKAYAYAQRDNPRPTRYLRPPAGTKLMLTIQPRGLEYWQQLADIIEKEPVEERDRFFLAMLRPLGIEKGKPFKPDERQKKILLDAGQLGEAMAKANSFDKRFPGSRYREDAHWDYVLMLDPAQDLPGYSQLDERAAYFYEGVATSKGMVSQTPGVGQAYLGSYRDKAGHAFDGANTYRLRIPANPPAKQFWSLTVYDLDTRTLIQSRQQIADRSSRMDIAANPDGTVDIYVGPRAPKGAEKNWIPSVPGKAWFAYVRLYGPTEGYFDKSWPLPDFEKVN
ncbi:DUF1214 domain-containing protein [Rhizobium lusitanum]|uniref:DUF1214 domain-containing protein n=1 Tax=Rhizobium lusitanum TaxID=293958 RepID=A0A6L9UC30_9HYPH|nr:DUF1254 domain-containing protein [Rhizobium lusitanum]NEI73154.1 DUF1214 domain-containing protein [Rhizobium lusitanum]